MESENKDYLVYWPIVISVLSLVFSIYVNTQLNKTREAQVIISQPEIKVVSFAPRCPSGSDFPCDEIDPLVKNVGSVIAEDVRIEFFGCFFNENITFTVNSLRCVKYWDTKLISGLPAGQVSNFGVSYITHELIKNNRNITGEKFVLIFDLTYKDDLTNNKKEHFYFFQYNIGEHTTATGGSAISYLTSDDYTKMCPWLERDLFKAGAGESLLGHVYNKCS